jgi:hypothetical protein
MLDASFFGGIDKIFALTNFGVITGFPEIRYTKYAMYSLERFNEGRNVIKICFDNLDFGIL